MGETKFIVVHSKIDEAVTNYKTALDECTAAKEAFDSIDAILKESWDDEAKKKWDIVYAKYSTAIENMKSKIANNVKLMTTMQTAAAWDQKRTMTGIEQLVK